MSCEVIRKTIDGIHFLLCCDDSNVVVSMFLEECKLSGHLDSSVMNSHKISNQDYIKVLMKEIDTDSQFYWELHNNEKLILFQKLAMDETSTIKWAVFDLKEENVSIKNCVAFINKLMIDNLAIISKLETRDTSVNILQKEVSKLEVALHENKENTDKLEAELLHNFSEILNSKKQKIRQLQNK